jgi:hypothetical protein
MMPNVLDDLGVGQGGDIPTSAKLETDAITRRMIFPDLVFGMSGTIHTFLGRAILPISVSIALPTLSFISLLGLKQGLSET